MLRGASLPLPSRLQSPSPSRARIPSVFSASAAPVSCGLGSPQLLEECGDGDWRSPLMSTVSTSSSSTTSSPSSSSSSPSSSSSSNLVPIVALGKFDAMHRGHRSLAAAAAQIDLELSPRSSEGSGGARASGVLQPWLVSFSGMAEVLGWEPRRPLVAPCDRARVLGSWAQACGGLAPRQRIVPFAAVRSMGPEEFVEALTDARVGLGARGVVVGEGHRFGRGASGDTALLRRLCEDRGVAVRVVGLVRSFVGSAEGGSCGGDVISSSAVRAALAGGRVVAAAALLGRRYRVVARVSASSWREVAASGRCDGPLFIPDGAMLNQPPRAGQAYSAAATVAPASATPVGASGVVDLRDVDVSFRGEGEGGGADVFLPPGMQWPKLFGSVDGRGPSDSGERDEDVRLTLDF